MPNRVVLTRKIRESAARRFFVVQHRTGKEIRDLFIKFWEGKGSHHYPSFSLIPDDPSLLFTIAGMVPYKMYY
jgi:alanyl-tRNA synthetase